MKNKKQFTLIELIIVIVVIGILAAMALPKFNGVIRNAKLSAMINDKEVLEKTLIMYYQKNDKLPLLNEDQELMVINKGISLSKIVLAEEAKSSDMETIYKSLKETLNHYSDSEETLYRINLNELKNDLSKGIKYGHKKQDKDFYVYSTKTGNVYYYDYLVNGNGTIQHTEYDTLLKENELITKTKSPSLNGEEIIINNKPIIELTTDLEDITTDTIIKWEYKFIDEDASPTKISFILNYVEYDSFDKIPTKLEDGNYNIKLKIQDSKGLWSNEIIKSFLVEKKTTININSIVTGDYHSMKIGDDGNLYSWGNNEYGQLGIGNIINQTTPQLVELPNNEKPISIALGGYHSMAITDKGNLYAWGYNRRGELGIGTSNKESVPVKVNLPNGEIPKMLSLSLYNSMVITNEGNIYAWGDNNKGQLGIGNVWDKYTPQLVKLPNEEKAISISLGYGFAMAITDKGKLYAWGSNAYGQLGIGNKFDKLTPTYVTLPNGEIPKSISLGFYHSMLITESNNLYGWGYNGNGELGLGNVIDQTTPQKIILPNQEKPLSISLGISNSATITVEGNLYAWGYNNYGQLGIGNTTYQITPKLVTMPNGEKPISIALGGYHTMVTTDKDNFYTWGSNNYGQLGIGNNTNQLVPIKVTLP